jgi:hypothetical protein
METIIRHEHDTDTETYELGKYTKSFGLSFAITSLISALLVVVKETHEESVLAWMKSATGHHWVTHGVLDLILFGLIGWVLARPNNGQGINITAKALVTTMVVSLVISWLIIIGFYA